MASFEKILIIDDEKGMCDSLSVLLQGDGYKVETFQVPSKAIERIRAEKVDLVITDIKMPDMSGLDILKAVKEQDEGIPVIFMTGYGSLDTAIHAVSQGADDYLLKPVEFTYLLFAVNRALDKRRSELARFRLLEELKLSNLILNRRVGELNALYEAGKSIGSSINLNDLLRQIVTLAATVTEAQIGSIMLLDERKEFLKIAAAIGLENDIILNTRLPIGASISGYVAKTGEALMVANVENDDRFRRMNRDKYGAASLLCTPLKIKNNVLGVINMANKQDGQQFTDDDLRLLTTFASQAAVAVDDAYEFEKSRRRLVEFEILQEMSNELPVMDSLVRFRTTLVDKLRRVFPIDYAVWFSWNAATGILSPDSSIGETDLPQTDSGKIDISKAQRSQINLTQFEIDSLDLTDLQSLSAFIGEKISERSQYPKPDRAYMAIPTLRNGELAYLFYFGSESERTYSDEDMSLARLVVSQSALLFEKEKTLLNATRLITMGNMISEISHDLRKPLTSFSGGLQILKQRWPEICDNSDFFKTAEEEVHRMNELVRELVDFSNPNKYETTKFDLRHTISRSAELVAPDLRKGKVKFEAVFDDSSWEVIANKNQILEMFLNLFINAIDAMPKGGSLTVVGCQERPDHKKEDYLAVKVIDTGVGIKKEHLSQVFDRYYTTKETGTGLGLVVVERIISAHNGTLKVESSEGIGTTFTVYFPLQH